MSPFPDWRRWPAIDRTRRWSLQTLSTFRSALESECRNTATTVVAVSGSLGRLDARPGSDCDAIVLVREDASREERNEAMQAVQRAAATAALAPSKNSGVFAKPVGLAELIVPTARGKIDENLEIYGKRIQLLLDSQPAFGTAAYQAALDAVLRWWSHGFITDSHGKQWTALLNDVLRYWRTYCVSRQWDFSSPGGGWYPRDSKLRHSRYLMCGAFLALLGEAGAMPRGQRDWLLERLADPPLERLAGVYARCGESERFATFASAYDRFLESLEDAQLQAEWAAAQPQQPSDLQRAPESYRQIRENAQAMQSELTRFFLARQQAWPRFVELLLL